MPTIEKQIKAVELDSLFSFKPESEPIPHSAIKQIEKFIELGYSDRGNIDWRPMNEKGALVKRLKTYMYKKHSIKVSATILEKIGAIVADNSIATKEYALDITENFEWNAGDFGDHGSCFFGGRTGIRQDMEEDGRFKSLRFFQRDFLQKRKGTDKFHPLYAGIGRSWIWTTNITAKVKANLSIKSGVYVVFNGYGPSTQWQASFLSAYLGLPMKQVMLTNHGETCGGLYVNNGLGYIIGPDAIITNVSELDFGLNDHNCKAGRNWDF